MRSSWHSWQGRGGTITEVATSSLQKSYINVIRAREVNISCELSYAACRSFFAVFDSS